MSLQKNPSAAKFLLCDNHSFLISQTPFLQGTPGTLGRSGFPVYRLLFIIIIIIIILIIIFLTFFDLKKTNVS